MVKTVGVSYICTNCAKIGLIRPGTVPVSLAEPGVAVVSELSTKAVFQSCDTKMKNVSVLQEVIFCIKTLVRSLTFIRYLQMAKRSLILKFFLVCLFIVLIYLGLDNNTANIIVLSIVPVIIIYGFFKLPFIRIQWIYKTVSLAHCISYLTILWYIIAIVLPFVSIPFATLLLFSVCFCIELDALDNYQVAMNPDPHGQLPPESGGPSSSNNPGPNPGPNYGQDYVPPPYEKDDKPAIYRGYSVMKSWLGEKGFVEAPDKLTPEEAKSEEFWRQPHFLKDEFESETLSKLPSDIDSIKSQMGDADVSHTAYGRLYSDHLLAYHFHLAKGKESNWDKEASYNKYPDLNMSWEDLRQMAFQMDRKLFVSTWFSHSSASEDYHKELVDKYSSYVNFYQYKTKEKSFIFNQLDKKKEAYWDEIHSRR